MSLPRVTASVRISASVHRRFPCSMQIASDSLRVLPTSQPGREASPPLSAQQETIVFFLPSDEVVSLSALHSCPVANSALMLPLLTR